VLDTLHNVIQHNDTQRKGLVCYTEHINALHYAECGYAECYAGALKKELKFQLSLYMFLQASSDSTFFVLDTLHNVIRHNDTQHKGLVCDTEYINALHNAECHYAECYADAIKKYVKFQQPLHVQTSIVR
jgi:hypothetical protein